MPKNFSYIHVEKLKCWGRGKSETRAYKQAKYTRSWGVQGCWEHDMRIIETPNADPKKFARNAVICAETGWQISGLSKETMEKTGCEDPEFVTKKAKELFSSHKISARSDQAKVTMLIMAVSPEFLRDGDKSGKINSDKVQKWADGSIEYLKKTFGERLIAAVIHVDELNPHMSAYVVPLVEKEVRIRGPRKKDAKDKPKETVKMWRLCSTDLYTPDPYRKEKGQNGKIKKVRIGKGSCSIMQEEYAETLQRFGLKIRRGVRRAPHQKGLEHETNRLRYERLSAPIADVMALDDTDLRIWAIDAAPQAEEAKRSKTERDHYQIAAADAQEKVEELKKIIRDSHRSLAVSEVISKLFDIDPRKISSDESEYLLPNGQKILIKEKLNRFENLTPKIPFISKTPRQKGQGAIDAITLLTGWDVQQATEYIADNFTLAAAKSAMSEKVAQQIEATKDDDQRQSRADHAQKITNELEQPDPDQWKKVAEALQKTFKIPLDKFEGLHESNWLDANKFGHLLCTKGNWDEENDIIPTGKIIIDLKNPEQPLKETGENGLVFMTEKNRQAAVFCASPLDALAIASNPDHQDKTIFVVGNPTEKTTAAVTKITRAFKGKSELAENISIIGIKISDWMTKNFPQIPSLKLPEGFQSWLDHHSRPRLKPDQPKLRIVQFPIKETPENISNLQ